MEKDPEVQAAGRDVAAELPAGAVAKAFGGLQFHDDAPVDEHIYSMKADSLTMEVHRDRVLSINLKPSTS